METLTAEQKAAQEAQKKIDAEGNKPIATDAPANAFIAKFIGGDAEKKAEAKAKKKASKPVQDDDGEGKAHDDLDGSGDDTAGRAPATGFDEEKLGRSIAENLAPHLKPKADDTASKKDDDEALDPKEKRRLEVLFHMEQMAEFGGKYKGAVERYKESKKKAVAEALEYKRKWEEENPGEKFDEDAEEHAETLDAIDAKIDYPDDDDFDEAKVDLLASKRLAEKSKQIDERVEDVERVERARKEAPKVVAVAESAGNSYWKDLGDDFKDVLTEDGKINNEALASIRESDPVKFDIAVGVANAVETGAAMIYRLANGLEKFDRKNDGHLMVNQFAIEREQRMLARPKEKQLDNKGRTFVSSADYAQMTPAQQKKHWTFTGDDLIYMYTRHNVAFAKQQLDAEEKKFRSRAVARGLMKGEDESGGVPEKRRDVLDDDDDASELGQGGKPVSPSSASTPKAAGGKRGQGSGPQTNAERFLAKL